jgi:hypothetical protein
MRRLLKPLFPLFAVIAAGCGIGPHVDDYNESLVASGVAGCNCGGAGYPSEAVCREEVPPNTAEQACIEALFKNIDGDYEVHLDCRTAAQNRLAGCLNSHECSDGLGRLACANTALMELADCPDFPADVQQELNECST